MRLFSYRLDGATRPGVMAADRGVDVAVLERAVAATSDDEFVHALQEPPTGPMSMIDLLRSGRDRMAALAAAVARLSEAPSGCTSLAMDSIEFALPTVGSQKILCVGRNYLEHIKESDREVPGEPVLFCRYEDSLVPHGEAIERPSASDQLDWEGELAAVIGVPCRHVDEQHALDVVAGYAVFNDGSVRDYQHHSVQWTPGKNFYRSGSYGPFLVTYDDVADPQDLDLETRVNDTVVQESSTATMIFPIARIISYISEWTQLNPGDVIATGTPAGIGGARTPKWFLEPGDVVTVSITGLGTLRNPVVDAELPPGDRSGRASERRTQ